MASETKDPASLTTASRAAAQQPGSSGKSMPAVQAVPHITQLQADGAKQVIGSNQKRRSAGLPEEDLLLL